MAFRDPEAEKAYQARWYQENKARIHARQAAYYAANPDKKARAAAQRKDWAAKNRDQVRNLTRRKQREYSGVVDATAETKCGPCEICGRVCALDFDHDHATGHFRGWLCRRCNMALGLFADDPDALRAALAYLERATPQAA